jgi:hypothetical protein
MAAGNNGMNRGVWAHIGVVALRVVALATACTTTQQTAVKRADLKCGLLGSDCGRLTPGARASLACAT